MAVISALLRSIHIVVALAPGFRYGGAFCIFSCSTNAAYSLGSVNRQNLNGASQSVGSSHNAPFRLLIPYFLCVDVDSFQDREFLLQARLQLILASLRDVDLHLVVEQTDFADFAQKLKRSDSGVGR